MILRMNNSTLTQSSTVYIVSTMINSAIPFFMLPVLTRYLTPTGYGIVAMFTVLLGLLSPFIGLSIHGAISVKYFDKNTTMDFPKYVGNCFFLLLISSSVIVFIVWLFSAPISRQTAVPPVWLYAIILVSVGRFLILTLLTLWQVQNMPIKYAVFQNLQTVVNVLFTILLVVGLSRNWQGRIEALVLTIIPFAFSAFFLMYRNGWLNFTYDRHYIANALKFGVPLIPHVFGAMLITQTDRIFIAKMVSVADAGIYTVGFQIALVVELIASSFNKAYTPWLYGKLRQNTFLEKIRIVKLTYIYFVTFFLFALGFALSAPWILSFFVGREFTSAYKYTVWLALGFSFNGMYYMVVNYIFYVEKTHLLAWVTSVTALTNIVLNYLLIKRFGPIGAAQASTITFFLIFILSWYLSARVYDMPWNLKRISIDNATNHI